MTNKVFQIFFHCLTWGNKQENGLTLFLASYNLSLFLLYCAVFMHNNCAPFLVTVSNIAFDLFDNLDFRNLFNCCSSLSCTLGKVLLTTPSRTTCFLSTGYNYHQKKGIWASSIAEKRSFKSFWQIQCSEIVELRRSCSSFLVMSWVPSISYKSKEQQSLDCRLTIFQENWWIRRELVFLQLYDIFWKIS